MEYEASAGGCDGCMLLHLLRERTDEGGCSGEAAGLVQPNNDRGVSKLIHYHLIQNSPKSEMTSKRQSSWKNSTITHRLEVWLIVLPTMRSSKMRWLGR